MGLRTKISAIFVPLLVLAVLAVSATEANHAVGVMVESLGDSGTVLVNQTFEQIRTALAHTQGDAATVLRKDVVAPCSPPRAPSARAWSMRGWWRSMAI